MKRFAHAVRRELWAWAEETAAATLFLTRVPIRWRGPWPPDLSARALRAFPVVGLGIGLLGGLVYGTAVLLGLPALPAAVVTVAVGVALTGAMHEDALADTCDGLGGGQDRDAKLRIMRDSRLGAYGAVALVLALLARVAALAALAGPLPVLAALAAAEAGSRSIVVLVATGLAPARSDGLAADLQRLHPRRAVAPVVVAVAVAVVALGPTVGLGALVIGGLAALAVAAIARAQLGGHTGDVLGAVQQVALIAMLLAATAG